MPTFAEVLANSQKPGAAACGGAEADGEKNLDEIDDGPEDKWTLSKLGLGHGTAEDYKACGAFLEESSCKWPSPEIDRPRRFATLLDRRTHHMPAVRHAGQSRRSSRPTARST